MDGFVELVATVPSARLDGPGLGEWSVRELIGHTARALVTVEDYYGREGPGDKLEGPVAYWLAGANLAPSGSDARRRRDEGITDRARKSAEALGEDIAGAVSELAGRVLDLVDQSSDDMPMATSMGPMTLRGYLPTRTFELAVHTLDLAEAVGLPAPEVLKPAVSASLVLAARLAAVGPGAGQVLLALSGRRPLPPGFSVI